MEQEIEEMDSVKYFTQILDEAVMKAELLDRVIGSESTKSLYQSIKFIREKYPLNIRTVLMSEFKGGVEDFYVTPYNGHTFKISIQPVPEPNEKKKWYKLFNSQP
jgi:hypothetical protein